jgi:hypothetical protein
MDDKLTWLLEDLSKKMGTTVDHLYQVLVKQAKIDAIVSVISLVVMFLLLPVCWIAWQHLLPHCIGKEWPMEIQLVAFALGICTLLLTIFTIVQLFSTIDDVSKGIFNPEASAVEKILGYINNKK